MIQSRTNASPWPRVPVDFVRAMLSGHSALGLACGALIYLVCLTGTLAVFVNELQVWEQPDAPVVDRVGAEAIGRAMRLAYEATGPSLPTDIYASLQPVAGQHLVVAALGNGLEKSWDANAAGDLTSINVTPWTDFAGDLHMTLTLPSPWGGTLVGIVGVALFALLLSGILSHPRIFRDAFMLRLGGSPRLREADLHNRLSVWGLPFHIAVTLTGAFFGLSILLIAVVARIGFGGDTARVIQILDGPPVAANPAPAGFPELGAMIAQALAGQPDGYPTFVGLERPGTAGQRVMIEVDIPRRLARGERFYFDGDGKAIGKGGFTAGSVGLQAYAAAASLHFGTFGGMPVKLAYGVLGLALTAISSGGTAIWLIRRRDRGRPLPRLEKVWAAVVWGIPLALAVSAIGSRVAPPSVSFWIAAAIAIAASLAAPNGRAASRWFRWALVCGLIGMMGTDLACFGWSTLNGFAAWVNAAWVLAAFIVGAFLMVAKPRSA